MLHGVCSDVKAMVHELVQWLTLESSLAAGNILLLNNNLVLVLACTAQMHDMLAIFLHLILFKTG